MLLLAVIALANLALPDASRVDPAMVFIALVSTYSADSVVIIGSRFICAGISVCLGNGYATLLAFLVMVRTTRGTCPNSRIGMSQEFPLCIKDDGVSVIVRKPPGLCLIIIVRLTVILCLGPMEKFIARTIIIDRVDLLFI